MNSIDAATEKANSEIKKNLHQIKELSIKCNFGELAYCLYSIHTIRVLKTQTNDSLVHMNMERFDDVLKHTLSCIFKYSNISKIPQFDYYVDVEKSILLTKYSNHTHTLYELISNFTLLNDIELLGKENRYVKIDFSQLKLDETKTKSFEYSARFQRSNSRGKKALSPDVLLEKFLKKYSQYDFISKEKFGLTITEMISRLQAVLMIYFEKFQNNEPNMDVLDNGNIDVESLQTLIEVVKSFIIDEKTIKSIFGKTGMKFIRLLTFKKSEFKSHELAYHYIIRKPILKIKNQYIIVPELLLDSLFTTFHYTLLEDDSYSEKHKQLMSDLFVDEISHVGMKYNLFYFDKEVDLYKGRNKLGDIDLILRCDEYDLLIEAKNHNVPLSVYFGDHEQIDLRLKQLQKEWEDKVNKRYEHLLKNYEKYNINKNFKYLVVSRFPEILSHHSDFLVLSLEEFEYYLQNQLKYTTFQELYDDLYKVEDWDINDVEAIMKETLSCTVS